MGSEITTSWVWSVNYYPIWGFDSSFSLSVNLILHLSNRTIVRRRYCQRHRLSLADEDYSNPGGFVRTLGNTFAETYDSQPRKYGKSYNKIPRVVGDSKLLFYLGLLWHLLHSSQDFISSKNFWLKYSRLCIRYPKPYVTSSWKTVTMERSRLNCCFVSTKCAS